MHEEFSFFAGSSNPELAKEIAKELKTPLGKVELTKFADGENYVNYLESVRGKHVYILQSTGLPQNDNLMELLLMIDAAKRAAAERVTCVIPYYGYAKQDRKANDREPITAKLVAKLIQADFIYASGTLTKYIQKKSLKNTIVMAPDVGSTKRARKYANILGTELAVADKRRPKPNQSEVVNLIGDVKNKVCIIVDDEINTGGTVVNAAAAAIKNGAKEVYVLASHGVFASNALEKIEKSPIKEVIVTNSLPQKNLGKKITVISVAPLIAQTIQAMQSHKSISQILNS